MQPPEGAPNVLLVLIDDAGFGNPSTFGGRSRLRTTPGLPKTGCAITVAHPRSFNRIADVADSESIRRLVTLAGRSIPGRLQLFPNRDREQAEAWASEGLDPP